MALGLQVYADESEDPDSTVHAIAGFIGRADEWDSLQELWISRVKPTGVTAYHMTDCENGKKEFKTWSEEKRTELTKDLIGLIKNHSIYLIGVGLDSRTYATLPPVNRSGRRLGNDKWTLTYQAFLDKVGSLLNDSGVPETEPVAFFFDFRTKQNLPIEIFDATATNLALGPWRKHLGTVTFGRKEFDVPGSIPLLQVADIAAVETRKAIGNPITHRHLPVRKSFAALAASGQIASISYLDANILKQVYEGTLAELTARTTGPKSRQSPKRDPKVLPPSRR